jgi:NitT/TauT family transport system substrate-binding protein
MEKINLMALRHSAFYSPYLMTFAGSFLKDEGLEASYKVATKDCTVDDSILDGSCHVAQSAVATRFADLEAGKKTDIVHFAQINERDGFYIAAREKDDNFTWSKLRGKKVLVDHFFQPYAMLNYALHKNDMTMSDFEVIDAGDVDQIENAFRNGQGDYVHMQGPYPQQLEAEGLAHVVASVGEAVGPVAFSSLCAHRDWLQTEMATAFMKAYKKSVAYVIAAPAEEIAAKEKEAGLFPPVDQSVLAETIRAYQTLGCWQTDISISTQSIETLQEVFLKNGNITKSYEYEQLVKVV